MEGKWELTVHTYMGDMRSHMEYHVEGNVLTGTGEDASNGAVAQIENGRFENGEFSNAEKSYVERNMSIINGIVL